MMQQYKSQANLKSRQMADGAGAQQQTYNPYDQNQNHTA